MEWPHAIDLAKNIRLLLLASCERVEIAGSLRRMRSEVNDIELVAVPKRNPFDQLHLQILDMLSHHLLEPGLKSKDGKKAPCGPRYYRLQIPNPPFQLDLFAVFEPADWGIIFTIRTGSAAFSHWLVTEALRRGFKVQDGQLFKIDRKTQPWILTKIPCPNEGDLFRALGLAFIDPPNREIPPSISTAPQPTNQPTNHTQRNIT